MWRCGRWHRPKYASSGGQYRRELTGLQRPDVSTPLWGVSTVEVLGEQRGARGEARLRDVVAWITSVEYCFLV